MCVMMMMLVTRRRLLNSAFHQPCTVQREHRPTSPTPGRSSDQRLCQPGPFRGRANDRQRCSGGVFTEWSDSGRCRWEGAASKGEWARRREKRVRQRGDRGGRNEARQTEGVEELAKLSLTAAGPLDNSGILSEINLSSRSC